MTPTNHLKHATRTPTRWVHCIAWLVIVVQPIVAIGQEAAPTDPSPPTVPSPPTNPSISPSSPNPNDSILPPVDREANPIPSVVRFRAREIIFDGNTVFPDEQLSQVVTPFLDRPLTTEDLEEIRQAITVYYVNAGYINSGAVLPDQRITEGRVKYKIIEGRLSKLDVTGTDHLRPSFIEDRFDSFLDRPLNVAELREKVELIRQNPNVARIHASLNPGDELGTSVLSLDVAETDPINLSLTFSNDSAPSVGAENLSMLFSHTNLTGRGDLLSIRYGITQDGWQDMNYAGLDDVDINYVLPITSEDTTLIAGYGRSSSQIVEEPFDRFGIESEMQSVVLGLRHPFYRDVNSEFAMSIMASHVRLRSTVDGQPQPISPGSSREGENRVTSIRFGQEWITRNESQVLALSSTVSFGIDAFGSTRDRSVDASGFTRWQGQATFIQRLFESENQLVARIDGQVADQPMVAGEQFVIGGMHSVRGYRENQVLRDMGVLGSLELRLPIWMDGQGRRIVQLMPFLQGGFGSNVRGGRPDQLISSAGLGLAVNPIENLSILVYWGHPFKNFESGTYNLQDDGLHFRISLDIR